MASAVTPSSGLDRDAEVKSSSFGTSCTSVVSVLRFLLLRFSAEFVVRLELLRTGVGVAPVAASCALAKLLNRYVNPLLARALLTKIRALESWS